MSTGRLRCVFISSYALLYTQRYTFLRLKLRRTPTQAFQIFGVRLSPVGARFVCFTWLTVLLIPFLFVTNKRRGLDDGAVLEGDHGM